MPRSIIELKLDLQHHAGRQRHVQQSLAARSDDRQSASSTVDTTWVNRRAVLPTDRHLNVVLAAVGPLLDVNPSP